MPQYLLRLQNVPEPETWEVAFVRITDALYMRIMQAVKLCHEIKDCSTIDISFNGLYVFDLDALCGNGFDGIIDQWESQLERSGSHVRLEDALDIQFDSLPAGKLGNFSFAEMAVSKTEVWFEIWPENEGRSCETVPFPIAALKQDAEGAP